MNDEFWHWRFFVVTFTVALKSFKVLIKLFILFNYIVSERMRKAYDNDTRVDDIMHDLLGKKI